MLWLLQLQLVKAIMLTCTQRSILYITSSHVCVLCIDRINSIRLSCSFRCPFLRRTAASDALLALEMLSSMSGWLSRSQYATSVMPGSTLAILGCLDTVGRLLPLVGGSNRTRVCTLCCRLRELTRDAMQYLCWPHEQPRNPLTETLLFTLLNAVVIRYLAHTICLHDLLRQ